VGARERAFEFVAQLLGLADRQRLSRQERLGARHVGIAVALERAVDSLADERSDGGALGGRTGAEALIAPLVEKHLGAPSEASHMHNLTCVVTGPGSGGGLCAGRAPGSGWGCTRVGWAGARLRVCALSAHANAEGSHDPSFGHR
jgi:hypothetical protein